MTVVTFVVRADNVLWQYCDHFAAMWVVRWVCFCVR